MSQLFPKSISQRQQELLQLLGSIEIGTLVGGTALALQLGHRMSYDLDFVTNVFEQSDVDKLKQSLNTYQLQQHLLSDTQYTAFANDVKITLFEDTAPFLHPIVDFNGARLASYQDIFSTKLYILGRRATWRDYCDIAVILDQHKITLSQGINEAMQRYQVAERWILEPLTYFGDLEMLPIEWIEKEYSEDEIKHILQEAAKEYMN